MNFTVPRSGRRVAGMPKDRRPILLGMNNPLSEKPEHALFPHPPGCTGWRIWQMLRDFAGEEVTRAQYLAAFDRRNLVDGKTWDRGRALAGVDKFVVDVRERVVVVFGEAPRVALRLPKLLMHPQLIGDVTWRQLPHPSGRCRWYNDPNNRAAAGTLLAELYHGGKL